jgi:hypothetical protein
MPDPFALALSRRGRAARQNDLPGLDLIPYYQQGREGDRVRSADR